jgi:hypothetical protein
MAANSQSAHLSSRPPYLFCFGRIDSGSDFPPQLGDWQKSRDLKVHLVSDDVHLSLYAKKIYREALLKIVADLDRKNYNILKFK